MRKEGFDKKLLRLHKEEKHIWRIVHTSEPVLLEKPIRKGWKRHFELRDDLKDKPDSEFFRTLLDKINTVTYVRKKGFNPRKRKTWKKSLFRYKQGLRTFSVYDFERRHCRLTEEEKQYFEPVVLWRNKRPYIDRYQFAEPRRFVLRIRPYYVTHANALHPSLNSRADEINNRLVRNHLRHKVWKLLDGSIKYNKSFVDRNPHPFKNKPFSCVLDMYEEEKQTMADLAEQNLYENSHIEKQRPE